MKKLMFAAVAAFCATVVANADGITSANIVGYASSELEQDGRNAKVPMFVSVGDPTGIKLSELSVKGYGEDGLDLGGCWGNVSIRMLTKSGANQKIGTLPVSYYWYDEDGEYEAGWYDQSENPLKDDESVLGNADEITFDVGEAFTVFTDGEYIGCTVMCNGQVYTGALNYPLTSDGRNMVGNPLPTPITLDKITVSGYEETEEGCWGNVSIRMLTKSGANQKIGSLPVSYYWYDEDGEYEAGWYDQSENAMTDDQSDLGNASDIEFAAGDGFVVFCDGEYVGCTVNFPAIKLN